MRTWIKKIVNKFVISNHTALILGMHALRNYLKLICEYELHSLPNKIAALSIMVKTTSPLVHHLLRNRLLLRTFFMPYVTRQKMITNRPNISVSFSPFGGGVYSKGAFMGGAFI